MKTQDIFIMAGVIGLFLWLVRKGVADIPSSNPPKEPDKYVKPLTSAILDTDQANVMRYYELIWNEGNKQRIEPAVIAAIIHHESSGNPNAKRWEANVKDFSWGLMQVRTDTARFLGFDDAHSTTEMLLKPDINIYYGVKYLSWQFNRYAPSMYKVISAYNCGTVNEAYLKKNWKFTNQGYVDIVVSLVPVYRDHFSRIYPNYMAKVEIAKDIFYQGAFY